MGSEGENGVPGMAFKNLIQVDQMSIMALLTEQIGSILQNNIYFNGTEENELSKRNSNGIVTQELILLP